VLEAVLIEALSDWLFLLLLLLLFLETLSMAAEVRRVAPALRADPENIVVDV